MFVYKQDKFVSFVSRYQANLLKQKIHFSKRSRSFMNYFSSFPTEILVNNCISDVECINTTCGKVSLNRINKRRIIRQVIIYILAVCSLETMTTIRLISFYALFFVIHFLDVDHFKSLFHRLKE